MIHLAYLSKAVSPLSDADLQYLLEQCHRNNDQLQVTGVLFYSHGHIAQLLEGEAAVVERLYERIAQDSRHANVRKIMSRPIGARSFADWSMAFHPLEPASFAHLTGFLDPTQLPPTPATLPTADALVIDRVRTAVFGPDARPSGTARS